MRESLKGSLCWDYSHESLKLMAEGRKDHCLQQESSGAETVTHCFILLNCSGCKFFKTNISIFYSSQNI